MQARHGARRRPKPTEFTLSKAPELDSNPHDLTYEFPGKFSEVCP
jgi:hypothetical protein